MSAENSPNENKLVLSPRYKNVFVRSATTLSLILTMTAAASAQTGPQSIAQNNSHNDKQNKNQSNVQTTTQKSAGAAKIALTPSTTAGADKADQAARPSSDWKKHTFLDYTIDCPAEAEVSERTDENQLGIVCPDRSLIVAIFEGILSEEDQKATPAVLTHTFFDNAYPPKSENQKVIGENELTVAGDPAYEVKGSYNLYDKPMISRVVMVRKANRGIFITFVYLQDQAEAMGGKMQHMLDSLDFKPGSGDKERIQNALKTLCSKEAVAASMASGMSPISTPKWSFDRPTDWELKQKPDKSAIGMLTMKGISCIVMGDSTIPEINSIPDAEGAFDLLKGESKLYADTLKKVKEEPLTINGCRAYRIEATAVDSGVDMTKEITMLRAGPKLEDIAFVVFQAPTIVFKDLRPMAEKVVASLKYTGQTTK